MADMKDYIVALKAEIVELRVALDQAKSVEVSIAAQRGSGSSSSEAWSTSASRRRQRKGKRECYCSEDGQQRSVGREPTVTYP